MSSVCFSSPYNSTFFTTCCRVAICDNQEQCPVCKEYVYPFYKGMTDAEREEARGGYYNSTVRHTRWSAAKSGGYLA